jgi:serine/threonine protein kinase
LELCHYCGTPLLINGQFRLLEPLRPLITDSSTEVFEVVDVHGTWTDSPGTHKVLKILNSTDSKLIELMQREADILQVLSVPGIPRVDVDGYFTFQLLDDLPELHCLILEKIPGDNLADWIEVNGRISQPLAMDWLQQLVEILDKLHSFGFFHRDIKPSNIIVRPDSKLALIDFGAVREVTSTYMAKLSRGFTSTSVASGLYDATVIRTACFTPLEQLNGKAVPQSDFYALGRTFIYLVTGISLVNIPTNSNTGQLLWRNKAPQIDKPFADLLDEMMAPFPGQRPRNTQLILQYLERIPFQTKLNRVVKSNPFKFGVIALSLLVASGIYQLSLPLVAKRFVTQGIRAEKEGRHLAAQNDFQLAVKLSPETTYPVSSFYFEQASRNQARPLSAKRFYQLAIQYNPQDIDAYNNLALVCQQLQDYSCVSNSYKKLFELKPRNWEGHYGLGNFYDDQGKYALAEQQYILAIDYSKNSAVDAMTNLSRLKNISGKHKEAAALSLQALSKTKDPGSQAASYKNLGWASLKQQNYMQAKEYLEKAKELDLSRTDTYCLLAQVQEALKDTKNARLSWEVCLIAQSNLPEVYTWRQQLLQRIWQE